MNIHLLDPFSAEQPLLKKKKTYFVWFSVITTLCLLSLLGWLYYVIQASFEGFTTSEIQHVKEYLIVLVTGFVIGVVLFLFWQQEKDRNKIVDLIKTINKRYSLTLSNDEAKLLVTGNMIERDDIILFYKDNKLIDKVTLNEYSNIK